MVLKAESKIRVPSMPNVFVRPLFLACHMTSSSILTGGIADREDASSLIEIRTLIPFMRTPLYGLITSERPYLLIPSH